MEHPQYLLFSPGPDGELVNFLPSDPSPMPFNVMRRFLEKRATIGHLPDTPPLEPIYIAVVMPRAVDAATIERLFDVGAEEQLQGAVADLLP